MSEALTPCMLIVAGSDSGAGAGIQADLKTCFAHGVYATTAITALTVQNTLGVSQVSTVSGDLVAAQMDSVMRDFRVEAVKLGMLGSAQVVMAVCDQLAQQPVAFCVLDPVLVSSSGAKLLDDAGVELLKERLLKLITLVTPNIAEASLLAGISEAEVRADPVRAAGFIRELGVAAVLIKGGHMEGAYAQDWLVTATEVVCYRAPRIVTPNSHGTGCTLASAIAAGLVKGLSLKQAVHAAKSYLTRALAAGASRRLGQGCGAMEHDVESADCKNVEMIVDTAT